MFCTVAVSGAATMLQASRLGRIGAGYVLTIGPAGPFIGICVTALAEGGPGLLAVLVLVSSLLPLAISARLSLFRRLLTSTIVGLPQAAWPGFDLAFGPAFAGLLPAFALLTLIGTIQTITAAVAVQRVSWRRSRAVDYRIVEGAVAADGISKMLCGIGGIMPTQTTTVSVPTIEITGVAARRVGIAAGALMIGLAFLPKVLAIVLAVPGPVYAAYLFVLLALIFVRGMSEVVHGGLDHRKGLIAGLGSGSASAVSTT